MFLCWRLGVLSVRQPFNAYVAFVFYGGTRVSYVLSPLTENAGRGFRFLSVGDLRILLRAKESRPFSWPDEEPSGSPRRRPPTQGRRRRRGAAVRGRAPVVPPVDRRPELSRGRLGVEGDGPLGPRSPL